MAKENPKVSVIICAYTMERLNDIHEAVDSVLAQTFSPHEVIVSVDHNEELYQVLKDRLPSEVKIVENNGDQGLSETRNVGIRTANGEIVAFIDDDAVAENDWLEKLTEPFQSQNVVAVGGRATPIWLNGRRPSWFPEELDWIVGCTYKGLPLKGNELRNVPGCNMAFRKEIFNQAGFWVNEIGASRQSQKGGEEAELCLRIKHMIPEAIILYQPDATIQHRVPLYRASLKWVFKNSFDQGICKAKVNRISSNQEALTTEDSYLHYLLFASIPQKLKCFYKKGSLSQTGAIMISIIATGAGYLMGRLRR